LFEELGFTTKSAIGCGFKERASNMDHMLHDVRVLQAGKLLEKGQIEIITIDLLVVKVGLVLTLMLDRCTMNGSAKVVY
jgi:hypothetical protein